ncbi:hypothetical protein V6N12_045463 [Hibiscus sabdariffa]|uniref:RNase H type-1 domain-containing protein n=1 Tax=Hibiscus sabdariffa TaxID=183260 RepID=A0ABR2G2X2_9ROSI
MIVPLTRHLDLMYHVGVGRICHNDYEDITHVLRDCISAQAIWTQVIHPKFESVLTECNRMMVELQRSNLFASHEPTTDIDLPTTKYYWSKPPVEWLKINVDGAVSLSDESASCGGLIRDSNGPLILIHLTNFND